MKYAEFMKSKLWRSMRAKFLKSSKDARCLSCRAVEVQLHHIRYGKFGDERISDLAPLCKTCHEAFHAATGKAGTMARALFLSWIASIFGIASEEVKSRFDDWVCDAEKPKRRKGRKNLRLVGRVGIRTFNPQHPKKQRGPRQDIWTKKSRLENARLERITKDNLKHAELRKKTNKLRPIPLVPPTAACKYASHPIGAVANSL